MGLLGKVFYNTGKASATRPWTSIFIGLVIACIGSLGFLNMRSTVSTLDQYAPQEPQIQRPYAAIRVLYGRLFIM